MHAQHVLSYQSLTTQTNDEIVQNKTSAVFTSSHFTCNSACFQKCVTVFILLFPQLTEDIVHGAGLVLVQKHVAADAFNAACELVQIPYR